MTTSPKRICVFCGSSPGVDPIYVETAVKLGHLLAHQGIGLVYGGASIGVMGAVANAALEAGGEVIGVMPKHLIDKEVGHSNLTELYVTRNMHERKMRMADLSDGFIALPGGMGTLEEVFEILTWGQLGIHEKPCGFVNVNGYYDKLLQFLDHSVEQGFLRPQHRAIALVDESAEGLLMKLLGYDAPKIYKWIDKEDR